MILHLSDIPMDSHFPAFLHAPSLPFTQTFFLFSSSRTLLVSQILLIKFSAPLLRSFAHSLSFGTLRKQHSICSLA